MSSAIPFSFCSFFFNAPATTEIYTLSLHDALPIYPPGLKSVQPMGAAPAVSASKSSHNASPLQPEVMRSEEHTSELQSHVNLVCRLLLEKKKKKKKKHKLK